MSSVTVTDTTQAKTLMDFMHPQGLADERCGKQSQAAVMAYLLAVLLHAGVWHLYKVMPPRPPEPEPLFIEATLVAAQPKLATAASAPPQAVVKPPPIPRPVHKVEKPTPKIIAKPKPVPKPNPKPKPVAKQLPIPEPQAEPDYSTATALKPAREAASMSTGTQGAATDEAPRAAQKAPSAQAQNFEYHPGHFGGFGRSNYPRTAKENGWEGTVRLKVHIQADGDIGEVIVIESSGHDMLDEAAVNMVKEGHATPARRGDKPVDSWVVVPYRFHLENE